MSTVEDDSSIHAASAPSAPTEPHTETDAREHRSSQLLAVGDRNETSLLITDLYNTHGNSPHSSPASASFAPSAGIAHTTRARPSAVAIHYFCNRYDRFAVGQDGFAVDGFYSRLAENAFLQGLQKAWALISELLNATIILLSLPKSGASAVGGR